MCVCVMSSNNYNKTYILIIFKYYEILNTSLSFFVNILCTSDVFNVIYLKYLLNKL